MKAANQRLVEPFAVRQQHHDRDDAPGDPEHREAGAHPVAHETKEGLAADLAEQLPESGGSAVRNPPYDQSMSPVIRSIRPAYAGIGDSGRA